MEIVMPTEYNLLVLLNLAGGSWRGTGKFTELVARQYHGRPVSQEEVATFAKDFYRNVIYPLEEQNLIGFVDHISGKYVEKEIYLTPNGYDQARYLIRFCDPCMIDSFLKLVEEYR